MTRSARARVRELTAFVVRFSGFPWLIRAIVARRRATIVVYHDPAPDTLDRHLAYLTSRYRVITLDQLAEALQVREWSKIPKRALVVTVDDGHRGNRRLTNVFAKHGVVPTLYLCSQIVATHRGFWFQKCDSAFSQGMKRLPQADRLEQLFDHSGFSVTKEYPDATALSASELQAMESQFDYGAHTRFHPILTLCSDAECETEIRGSRSDLEARFGKPCKHFSYPNGDYTDREVDFARRAGFASARTTEVGWNGPNTDPYRLRVTGVTDDASINMLAVQLSGIPAYLRCVAAGSWTGTTRKNLMRSDA